MVTGDLVVPPRPAGPHTRAPTALGMDLGGPFDRGRGGPGGWLILYEPELHFGGEVVVPDLAGWRRDQGVPDLGRAHFSLAPHWACEVLSPGTTKHDRGPKADVYAREGVEHLWLVDPLAKLLEAFALSGDEWRRLGAWSDEAAVRVPPFDAIVLELAALWVTTSSATGA
ncbi:MAG: Uma2 family endonuclease [Myxococcota bacterium]